MYISILIEIKLNYIQYNKNILYKIILDYIYKIK
jgi:hypothetical protein